MNGREGQNRGNNSVLRMLWNVSVLTLLALGCIEGAAAQTDDDPNDFPPPLKVLSKDERKALDVESDSRKRTRLSIDLMDKRLAKAEGLAAASAYRAMFFELGVFEGLMEDTLRFLRKNNRGSGRDLDNFKRFEIALRGFTPRIELLRRGSPPRYDGYLTSLQRELREARAEAVKPLFADTVVPSVREPKQ